MAACGKCGLQMEEVLPYCPRCSAPQPEPSWSWEMPPAGVGPPGSQGSTRPPVKGAAAEVIAGGAPRWEPVTPRGQDPAPAPPRQQQVSVEQVTAQQVPAPQVPAPQVPAPQVPVQQAPVQQAPVQQAASQQVPARQVPADPVAVAKPAPRRAWLAVLTLLIGLLVGGGAVSVLSLLGFMPWSGGGRIIRCGGGECRELQPGQAATLIVGGTGTLSDRVRIEVPSAALVEPATITVGMDEYELDLADVRHPGVGAFEVLGPTQVLEPHGQTFSAPVRVTLPYDRDRLSVDLPIELLAVLVERRDEPAAGRWEVVPAIDVDRSRGELSVLVQHFSKLTPIVDHDGFGALGLVAGMREWNDGIMAPEACNDMRTVADARDVVVDMEAFWDRIGLGHHTALGRVMKLGRYLDAEDGGEFPLGYLGFVNIKPLRTGHEAALYEMIRRHILSDGAEKLDSTDVLDMALEATRARTGSRNLPEAALTAHNVMRVLARPRHWSDDYIGPNRGRRCPPEDRVCGMRLRTMGFGHPRSDEMTPVFDDLMGWGGEDTLAHQLGQVRRKGRDTLIPSDYTMALFHPDTGSFAMMPGATDKIDNAGSHYYFWIGTMGYLALGEPIVQAGVLKETWVKESGKTAREGQGLVQGPQVLSGLAMARCLERSEAPPPRPPPAPTPKWPASDPSPPEASPGPAPVPTPVPVPVPTPNPAPSCPPQKLSKQKCPWSPDGYAVKPCPPGECYDAGPRGALSCKQIEVPANAKRNSWRNVECLSGFVPVKDPCQRTIKSCVPKSD